MKVIQFVMGKVHLSRDGKRTLCGLKIDEKIERYDMTISCKKCLVKAGLSRYSHLFPTKKNGKFKLSDYIGDENPKLITLR